MQLNQRSSSKALTVLILLFCSVGFAQQTDSKALRIERAEKRFDAALTRVFIHPDQLTEQGKRDKKRMIEYMVEQFENDFETVYIKKAFLKSEVSNVFRPVFVFANGKEIPLHGFEILQ